MTEDEIEKLAERVAELVMIALIEKQKEWDQQFTTDVNDMFSDGLGHVRMMDEEELLLAELARLMTLLSTYEEKEQLQHLLNKLDRHLHHLENEQEDEWE